MKKLLLHTCCAPCSIYVIQQLSKDYQVTVYFYGPNIHPRQEYLARRDEIKKYLTKIDGGLIEGEYDSGEWFKKTKGLEDEPERGKRCDICFQMRLEKTIKYAQDHGFDYWSSTLAISPHKDFKKISEIGNLLVKEYGLPFIDQDWKKNEGFKHACELSKQEGFYRQNYCGCIYSQR